MAFGDASKEFMSGREPAKTGGYFGSASLSFLEQREKDEQNKAQSERFRQTLDEFMPTLKAVSDASRNKETMDLSSVFRGTQLTRPVGEEIRAGEPSLRSKVRSLLPQSLAEKVYDPILAGFVGDPGEQELRRAFDKKGDVEPGLAGFTSPVLTRTRADKIQNRADALIKTGVIADEAYRIAQADVDAQVAGINALKADPEGLTEEQLAAIKSVSKWEDVDSAFFLLDIASLGRTKAAREALKQGLGVAEDVVRGARVADDVADEATHAILRAVTDEGGDAAQKATAFVRAREALANKIVDMREKVEDSLIRLKRLQSQGTITDATDTYSAEVTMSGRIGQRVEEGRQTARLIDSDVVETARKFDLEDQKLIDTVNDYLVALHAGERVAAIGDEALPMTLAQADEIIKGVESSAMKADIQRIAQQVKDLHAKTLDTLKEGDVITDELYTTLRKRYKQHVPLQRVLDDVTNDEALGAISGRSLDVRTTGIKAAKGSQRQVADIMENVIYNYEQAVVRAERNKVANTFARFIRSNPQLEGFKIRKPKAIGETFENAAGQRTPIMERGSDAGVFEFYENGKKMFIEIDDKHLLAVMQGIGMDRLPSMMRFVSAFTRFYSGLATRFNPEFAFTNKIRDIQEAIVYAAAQGQGASALKIAGDPRALAKGTVGGSMNTVRKFLKAKRNPGQYADILGEKDVQLYKQMLDDGGSTGGYLTQSIGDVRLDVQKLRKLNRSKPRQAAARAIEALDNFNKVFEESTRFSVYKLAIENGAYRQQAARMAKESTVNFNKMGTGGPVINALWMFSNASIQGSAKFLRAMKNPKVAAAVVTTVTSSTWAVNTHNNNVNPEWRSVVSKWDRVNGLPVMLPWTDEDGSQAYFVIPVSWGMKPLKVAADTAFDIADNQDISAGEAAEKIAMSLIEGYNPVGGSDIIGSIVPTFLDVPIEIGRNKAWYGGKIFPDSNSYTPDELRFYPDLKDTLSGRTAIRAADGLTHVGIHWSPENIDYAYNQYIGGAGRTASKVINTIASVSQGEVPASKDMPFLSRFFRVKTLEEIGAGSEKADTLNELLTEQERSRLMLLEEAENSMSTLDAMEGAERQETWTKIRTEDPDLAKKMVEIREQKERGLTYIDRKILNLGVENGMRARYIFEEIQSISDPERRNEVWGEYVDKKLVTDQVYKQIQFLREQVGTQ